jgi:hypothetical protein
MRPTVIPVAEAVAIIPDGARLMIGGFMGVGSPMRVIDELVRQARRDLTLIVNDTARPGVGVGKLIAAGLVRTLLTSHIGTNPQTQQLMLEGRIDVTLIPQGTLAERIRAGGVGLGGVLTPTGVGTLVAEGKQTIELDGHSFVPRRRNTESGRFWIGKSVSRDCADETQLSSDGSWVSLSVVMLTSASRERARCCHASTRHAWARAWSWTILPACPT